MKIKLDPPVDGVDVNIHVGLPTQDLEDLIDKITDAAVTIVVAVTVGGILKHIFTK
jgi:hypothetical protein